MVELAGEGLEPLGGRLCWLLADVVEDCLRRMAATTPRKKIRTEAAPAAAKPIGPGGSVVAMKRAENAASAATIRSTTVAARLAAIVGRGAAPAGVPWDASDWWLGVLLTLGAVEFGSG